MSMTIGTTVSAGDKSAISNKNSLLRNKPTPIAGVP